MEEKKTVDRRVRKTKRAIRHAFAKLLSQKDINDITIRDIADLADINRKTFYSYYSGIHQVVDEIENEVVLAFESVLGDIDLKRDLKNPHSIFERLTAIINTDLEFYGHLLSMHGNVSLVSKIVTMLINKSKEALLSQIEMDDKIADIVLGYAITGMIAVYQQWFNSDRLQSIEEISETISIMFFHGFSGVLEQQKNYRKTHGSEELR
ncbi:MAG: TetR/AcrR family transcriptional regulator [Clostridiaceae bacterium]|nr:TetR/AcrR family transcriptional regulator [Clostridiaceae bacterium]